MPDYTLSYANTSSAALSSSGYDVANLNYPIDLFNSKNEYGSTYAVFYINVQDASTVKLAGYDSIVSEVSSADSGKSPEIKSAGFTSTGLTTTAAGVGGFTATFVGKAGAVGAIGAGASTYLTTSDSPTSTSAKKRLKACIALHNPNQVITRYASSWGDTDTAGGQMLAQLGEGIVNLAQGDLDSAMKKVGNEGRGAIENLALQMPGVGNVTQAVTRQAPNAKKEMLFRGVEFRTFTFDYKFAPRSAEELRNVEEIIRLLKFHMHPEYKSGTGNFVYIYPSEFDIVYYHNGSVNPHMPKYTTCALQDMTVNYTPNGNFTSFSGGAPTHIDISLTFRELALLSKEDFAKGNY